MTSVNAKELAELDRLCFSVPWSEQSFLEESENRLATYFLVKEENKIIGYCGFWKVSGEAQITNIAVHPDYRKRGVATLLLEAVIKACEGAEQIVLEVRSSNSAAISLYKKFGFRAEGTRKRFYHDPEEDAVIMILKMS